MIRRLKTVATVILLAATTISFAQKDAGAEGSRPLTVVELFTSQGCSSCPPADKFLGDLALKGDSDDVLALSFHVDYWNNLGWPDPYSSAENTQRQKTYANRMNLRYVYTPQMVVQGQLQTTGSDRRKIQGFIDKARKMPRIDVNLIRSGDSLTVEIAQATHPVSADVFMVVFDNEHTTTVKRGENRGRTITNRNVVRSMSHIADWRGEAVQLASPINGSGDACAVIVQARDTGAILGAAKIAIN